MKCISDGIGCKIYSNLVPADKMPMDRLLFSESHSRYLLAVPRSDLKRVLEYLKKRKSKHAVIGEFGGKVISFDRDKKRTGSEIKLMVDKAQKVWQNGLVGLV